MSLPGSRSGHVPRRAAIALVLAALIAAPSGLGPTTAGSAAPPAWPAAVSGDGGLGADAPRRPRDGPTEAAGPAQLGDPTALGPSANYRGAEEHARDPIAFRPGARVTVPFVPDSADAWDVDGAAPLALPAGNASGQQLRASPESPASAPGSQADIAGAWRIANERRLQGPDDASVDTSPARGGLVTLASVTRGPGISTVDAAPVSPTGLRREVFGFLPYWELADDSTVLDWRTLSTVAYFGVGCMSNGNLLKRNPDGSVTTGWAGWTSSRMTSVIQSAHQHHTRVVLTVSCFAWSAAGATAQAALLGSGAARARLARQIAAAVRDRGADGVNLDFEPIVAGYGDEFTRLVRTIRAELSAVARGYQLTFDAVGSVGNQPIAAATAPGGADAVLVMAYDYRTANSNVAGSISPLTGPAYDLYDTVKAYTKLVSPSKVILGVPWYGRAWSTPTNDPHAKNISGGRYPGVAEPTYAQAADLLAAYGRHWDAVEQSPWTSYRRQKCAPRFGCVTSWRELYVDDAASLKLRYDLVNRAELRGVGIWALGFDGARPELRAALATKFLSDRTPPVTGIATLAPRQRDEGFRVAWTSYDDSSIRGYDVQVSADGGAWRAWLTATTSSSAIFLGADGHRYAFRVRGTDVHGNVSTWTSLPPGLPGTPASIVVGRFASVVTDGLRLRAAPSTNAAVMTRLHAGDALQVIGGPRTGDGYTWFQVAGPVRQWRPVDPLQVGGWVAAFGNGETNVAPRSPVYATRVDAGITGLRLNDGGTRVLTPNGDGANDGLRVTWTNQRAMDSIVLRIFRANGALVGTRALGAGKLAAGAHAFLWDGGLDGRLVPSGAYVVQVQGTAGAVTYSAPSAAPVSTVQLGRWGVVVGRTAPTAIVSATTSPASPTRAGSVTYTMSFGGPVASLAADDFIRGGTATGCHVGHPTGAGATWKVTVSGCSQGSLALWLRANAVADAVANRGPEERVSLPAVRIDRTAPTTASLRLTLQTGASLGTSSASAGLPASLAWSGQDRGGAGIASFDIRMSRDGGAFTDVAFANPTASLAISLAPGHAYRFEVRARDRAGNVGAWASGSGTRVALVQEDATPIRYGGTWLGGANAGFAGGRVRSSTSAGATVRYTFTGRGIAWVTTRGPDRGSAYVFVDGVLLATIDTHASSYSTRSIVWGRAWTGTGTHTVRIVVLGTAGHPRLDMDAFEVLR